MNNKRKKKVILILALLAIIFIISGVLIYKFNSYKYVEPIYLDPIEDRTIIVC